MNMSGLGLPPTNIVCVDCRENNDAQDDALPLLWHGYNLQTVSQGGHDKGANHGADDGSFPSEERRAADHYRCNRLQLITRAQSGLGRAKASRDHDTCEAGEKPRERVDND